jgi:site-specific DNA-cytosine methylase
VCGLIDGDKKLSWRKLTPLECERLQTVPDGYTLVMEDGKQKVSNSQRYKMLGNGWTIDVITHILKNMEL